MTLALLANTILFALCLDFVFRPYLFHKHYDLKVTRVGGVGPDFVKIFIRSPEPSIVQLQRRRSVADEPWMTCGTTKTSPEFDHTASVACEGLAPNTIYEYRWLAGDGKPLFGDLEEHGQHFRTAPAPGAPAKYSFASTSCVKPGFPYGTKVG